MSFCPMGYFVTVFFIYGFKYFDNISGFVNQLYINNKQDKYNIFNIYKIYIIYIIYVCIWVKILTLIQIIKNYVVQ